MLEVVFLGTSGSMPTEGRNLPAIAVRHEGRVLLFDAGEDVQRQLGKAAIGLNKRMAIFISHVHADHIIGLPGLLLRFSLLGRIRPLNIYGPKGIIEYVQMNQKTINLGTTFEAKVYEIEPGVIFSEEDLSVRAFEVDHRGYAMGYELVYQKPTGTFLPQKATDFGVPKGPMWGKLAAGESVTPFRSSDRIFPFGPDPRTGMSIWSLNAMAFARGVAFGDFAALDIMSRSIILPSGPDPGIPE